MLRGLTLPPDLRALARCQGGAFSLEQAVGLGVSPRSLSRMLDDGWLGRLSRGIYHLETPTWLTHAWAGVLIGGPRAVLGRRAAAHLWGVAEPPGRISVYIGVGRVAPTRPGPWDFIRADRLQRGSPPITLPEDTVLDSLRALSEDEVMRLVADVLHRRLTTPRRLRLAMDERQRLTHRRILAEVLDDGSLGVRSPLERRYRRDVELAHGLPRPIRQARVGSRRLDGLYEEWGVVIELDGAAYHSGGRALADLSRDADHARLGLVTSRFGWTQVTQNPCGVAQAVAATLAARGWSGNLRACRSCNQR